MAGNIKSHNKSSEAQLIDSVFMTFNKCYKDLKSIDPNVTVNIEFIIKYGFEGNPGKPPPPPG